MIFPADTWSACRVLKGRAECMSHTYISELMHVVFSTKQRRNTTPQTCSNASGLSSEASPERENGFKAIAVGSTETSCWRVAPSSGGMKRSRDDLSGGLRDIQCEHIATTSDHRLHKLAGQASSVPQ